MLITHSKCFIQNAFAEEDKKHTQLKWMLRQKINAVGISSPEQIPSDRRHYITEWNRRQKNSEKKKTASRMKEELKKET